VAHWRSKATTAEEQLAAKQAELECMRDKIQMLEEKSDEERKRGKELVPQLAQSMADELNKMPGPPRFVVALPDGFVIAMPAATSASPAGGSTEKLNNQQNTEQKLEIECMRDKIQRLEQKSDHERKLNHELVQQLSAKQVEIECMRDKIQRLEQKSGHERKLNQELVQQLSAKQVRFDDSQDMIQLLEQKSAQKKPPQEASADEDQLPSMPSRPPPESVEV
jgi:hypothetical protein